MRLANYTGKEFYIEDFFGKIVTEEDLHKKVKVMDAYYDMFFIMKHGVEVGQLYMSNTSFGVRFFLKVSGSGDHPFTLAKENFVQEAFDHLNKLIENKFKETWF